MVNRFFNGSLKFTLFIEAGFYLICDMFYTF
jgi:hypothetical protein